MTMRGRPRVFPLSPFGERLKAAIRRSPFKTRDAFRKAANIAPSSLYNYEMGQAPRADEVLRWAALLGVRVSDLLGEVAPDENDVMREIEKLDDAARARVLAWANGRWPS